MYFFLKAFLEMYIVSNLQRFFFHNDHTEQTCASLGPCSPRSKDRLTKARRPCGFYPIIIHCINIYIYIFYTIYIYTIYIYIYILYHNIHIQSLMLLMYNMVNARKNMYNKKRYIQPSTLMDLGIEVNHDGIRIRIATVIG